MWKQFLEKMWVIGCACSNETLYLQKQMGGSEADPCSRLQYSFSFLNIIL